MTQICSTCASFTKSKGKSGDLPAPWGRCDKERINGRETQSMYRSPAAACVFNPSRWVQK